MGGGTWVSGWMSGASDCVTATKRNNNNNNNNHNDNNTERIMHVNAQPTRPKQRRPTSRKAVPGAPATMATPNVLVADAASGAPGAASGALYGIQDEPQYTTLADITRHLCRVCDAQTGLHCFECNAPICGAHSFDYGFGIGGNTVHRYTVVTSRICFDCNEILHRSWLDDDASDATSGSTHPSMPSLIDPPFDTEPEDGQDDDGPRGLE